MFYKKDVLMNNICITYSSNTCIDSAGSNSDPLLALVWAAMHRAYAGMSNFTEFLFNANSGKLSVHATVE